MSLTGAADLAIDLRDVAKTYAGKVHALRGIQMRVARGEIFGLLGPNGAGKSTLVKILMTVIRPSRAEGTMLGHALGDKATLARVGYLPEHHRFPDYLTGAQVLDFYGAMANVPRPARRTRSAELLELVGMAQWSGKRIRSYSKGMRQRLGIAQALMNDPDLIVLDEPTDGVDPVGRRDIRNILQHIKDRGKTVFLNSHLLSELEMVCDRVAILVQGLVSSQGTLDELTKGRQRYEIEIAPAPAPAPGAGPEDTYRPLLPAIQAAGLAAEIEGPVLRIGTTDPHAIQPVLDDLRRAGAVLKSVRPHRPSLEDLFMQAVTDPTTGEILTPGAASDKKPARKEPGR
ncbi:MAG: ABC transporter ATP-binding protein [Phycisphaerales bacterium]|nr:ABC transporter ATP-binding protein [Phycisphaerales bacterium]